MYTVLSSSSSIFGNSSVGNMSAVVNIATNGPFFAEGADSIRQKTFISNDENNSGVEIFDFNNGLNSEDSEIKRIPFGNGPYCLSEDEELICALLGEEKFREIKEKEGSDTYIDISTMNDIINYQKEEVNMDLDEEEEDDVDVSQMSVMDLNHYMNFKSRVSTVIKEVNMPRCDFGSPEYTQYLEDKTAELDANKDVFQQMVDLYGDILFSTGFDSSDYKSVSQAIVGFKESVDDGEYFDAEEVLRFLMNNNIDPVEFLGKNAVELCELPEKELCKLIANALNDNLSDIVSLESAITSIEKTKSELWYVSMIDCEDFKKFDPTEWKEKIFNEIKRDELGNDSTGQITKVGELVKQGLLSRDDVEELFAPYGGLPPVAQDWQFTGVEKDEKLLLEMSKNPEFPEYAEFYKMYRFLVYAYTEKGVEFDQPDNNYNDIYSAMSNEGLGKAYNFLSCDLADYMAQYEGYMSYKDFYDSLDKDSFSDNDIKEIMDAVENYQAKSDKPMTYHDLYYALSKFNIDGLDNFIQLLNKNAPEGAEINFDELSDALDSYEWITDTTSVMNYLDTTVEGFGDGVGGYFDGLFGWINNDSYSAQDYKNMYTAQLLSDCGLLDFNYNLSSSIGNMAPSIALSLLNPALGKFSFFASAGGASVKNAKINYGATDAQAYLYGTLSGLSEVAFERFLGAIPGLSEVKVTGFKTWAKAAIKEGNEELLQNFVDRSLLKGMGIDPNTHIFDVENAEEDFKTWLMGVASGGVLNLPSAVIGQFDLNDKALIEKLMNDSGEYDSLFKDSADFQSLADLRTEYLLSKEYNFKKMDQMAQRCGITLNDNFQDNANVTKFLKKRGYSDSTIKEYMQYRLDTLAKNHSLGKNDAADVYSLLKNLKYPQSTILDYIRKSKYGFNLDEDFKKRIVYYKMLESHSDIKSFADAMNKYPDETRQAIRDCHREFVMNSVLDDGNVNWQLNNDFETKVKLEYDKVNGAGAFDKLSSDDRKSLVDDYKEKLGPAVIEKRKKQKRQMIEVEYDDIINRSISQLEKMCSEKIKVPYVDPVTGETKYSEVKAFKDGVTPEDLLLAAKANVDISQYCTDEYIEARMKHFGATSLDDTVKVYCFQSARSGDKNFAYFGGDLGYDAVYVFSECSKEKFLGDSKYFKDGVPANLDAMTNFGRDELGGVPLTSEGALIIEREISMKDVLLPKGSFSCSYDGYFTPGGFLLGQYDDDSSIQLKTPEATVPAAKLNIDSFELVQEADGFYYLKGSYVEDGVTYNVKIRSTDGTEESVKKTLNDWESSVKWKESQKYSKKY